MRTALIVAVAAAFAAAAWASSPEYVYEGQWSKGYRGNELEYPFGVSVAPNGNVYITEEYGIYYFSPTGSYLGYFEGFDCWYAPFGIDVHADGRVCVGWNAVWCRGGPDAWISCYTATGSLLRSWGGYGSGDGEFGWVFGVAVAPNGDVYAADRDNDRVQYFTAAGSFLGKWAPPDMSGPEGIAVAPTANVYVTDATHRVKYYTPDGKRLGAWGGYGSGDGQFILPKGVTVGADGRVFVADSGNHRIQYFTSTGSFLGKWGGPGFLPGRFNNPYDVAVSNDGRRVYVCDRDNHRIQYFRRVYPAVLPESLGKVKALFK